MVSQLSMENMTLLASMFSDNIQIYHMEPKAEYTHKYIEAQASSPGLISHRIHRSLYTFIQMVANTVATT